MTLMWRTRHCGWRRTLEPWVPRTKGSSSDSNMSNTLWTASSLTLDLGRPGFATFPMRTPRTPHLDCLTRNCRSSMVEQIPILQSNNVASHPLGRSRPPSKSIGLDHPLSLWLPKNSWQPCPDPPKLPPWQMSCCLQKALRNSQFLSLPSCNS